MQSCNEVCCFQILEAQDKVAEKTQLYVHYNILPLDPDSANQAIMRYPEVSRLVIPLWALFYICNMLSVGNVNPYCRSKLLFSVFATLEVFLGQKVTRKRRMKTCLIGFKKCLDFR